jgi:hypothetical protein
VLADNIDCKHWNISSQDSNYSGPTKFIASIGTYHLRIRIIAMGCLQTTLLIGTYHEVSGKINNLINSGKGMLADNINDWNISSQDSNY